MSSTSSTTRPLAIVTGASSGIGRELARLCAENGFDLILAADRGALEETAASLRSIGATVETVEADLATMDGVDALMAKVGSRDIAALLANAGHGLGRGFLEQDFHDIRHVIDTNIVGTLDLVQRVGRAMRTLGRGRILLTGSIAGLMPGAFQAVYNGTKAFIDSFGYALADELKDTGVTVTVLMPGATDTGFFERAGMMDTKVGTDDSKSDPADVAKDGFEAMMKGAGGVVSGWKNKVMAGMTNILPDTMLAEQHRKTSQPGTSKH